ncbi:MAG: heme o synthase [Pelagibacteraceae bacterium]
MNQSIIRAKSLKKNSYYSFSSFFNLMKPRVMSLVLFTSMVGLLIAPNQVSFLDSIISLAAIALGAGAAGTLNMWYESDLDALMSRTCLRPIPTGKIKKDQALWFGSFLSILSMGILYYSSNILSVFLLGLTISFYFFIYTIWLKRRTPQNIVIGGAAGALPPVIGWAVATGSVSIEPLILFLIIFIWTPSHFWALSLYKSNDYKKANIPMLPVVAGVQKTKLNILVYALLLAPTVTSLYFFNFSSFEYLIISSALTAYYIYLCYLLFKEKNNKTSNIIARKIFVYSIFYLFIIFVLILIDSFFKF